MFIWIFSLNSIKKQILLKTDYSKYILYHRYLQQDPFYLPKPMGTATYNYDEGVNSNVYTIRCASFILNS